MTCNRKRSNIVKRMKWLPVTLYSRYRFSRSLVNFNDCFVWTSDYLSVTKFYFTIGQSNRQQEKSFNSSRSGVVDNYKIIFCNSVKPEVNKIRKLKNNKILKTNFFVRFRICLYLVSNWNTINLYGPVGSISIKFFFIDLSL